MNINETNLKFKNLTARSKTVRAILHHSAGPKASAEDIHRWHLANRWSGAGYHFLVRKDGSVYRLRPEWAVGAHATGSNSDSIGICFEGNFMTETMPDEQKQAGEEQLDWVKEKYGFETVQAHRDVQATGCPGTNFPFEEIANGDKESNIPTPPASGTTYTVQKGDTLTAIAKKYNTTVDALAKASGITDPNKIHVGQTIIIKGAAEKPKPTKPNGNTGANPIIRDGQIHARNFAAKGLGADGIRGANTVKASIKVLQQAMNLDYRAGLAVDGKWGKKSEAALGRHTVRRDEKQYMVTALQILLMLKGYYCNGVDGHFGAGCEKAVRQYQADHGLTVDGIAGYNTFKSLIQ